MREQEIRDCTLMRATADADMQAQAVRISARDYRISFVPAGYRAQARLALVGARKVGDVVGGVQLADIPRGRCNRFDYIVARECTRRGQVPSCIRACRVCSALRMFGAQACNKGISLSRLSHDLTS